MRRGARAVAAKGAAAKGAPAALPRVHTTIRKKHGKKVAVCVSEACLDGTLKGGCYNTCKNTSVDMERFAPTAGSWQTVGKRTRFVEAYAAYQQAFKDGNRAGAETHRAVVEKLRTNWCDSCLESKHLSPAQQACKDEWERMKREACARHGGCQNKSCPERGDGACCVLEADHGTNPKKKDSQGKTVNLSRYKWWSCNGGVSAMREEAQQIEQWICGFCHALESTSASGRRCGDPKVSMPPGKRSGTPEEVAQYNARRNAFVRYPKQQHVDARKRAVGACAHCRRAVVAGQETAFDWDHRGESTKCKGGLYGKCGGVSNLVANCANEASLEKVRPLLDAEMDKCDLLCTNCHHRKTHGYLRRAPVA